MHSARRLRVIEPAQASVTILMIMLFAVLIFIIVRSHLSQCQSSLRAEFVLASCGQQAPPFPRTPATSTRALSIPLARSQSLFPRGARQTLSVHHRPLAKWVRRHQRPQARQPQQAPWRPGERQASSRFAWGDALDVFGAENKFTWKKHDDDAHRRRHHHHCP